MSRWDCYAPDVRHRIELKCRRAHYDTLLIERSKYDAMVRKCRTYSDAPIYINSTPQGVFAWDLSLIEVEWTWNKLNPATTHFSNKRRVPKEVGYLKLQDAKIFYKPINII